MNNAVKTRDLPERVRSILSCPQCGHSLCVNAEGAQCEDCSRVYKFSNHGQLDLRLQERKSYHIDFDLPISPLIEQECEFKPLENNPTSEVDFTALKTPGRLTSELMSYFPKGNHFLMLDIGCGDEPHREMCEYAGFEYVGLDIDSPQASVLGDALALPFKNNSFGFILSVAVLHLVRNPFVMACEAYRVLQPGGKFIGTVAFLEPFHSNGSYHHTHIGVFNTLRVAGFHVDHISPILHWPALTALAAMALFPKAPRSLAKATVVPLQLLHTLWWQAGRLLNPKANRINRLLHTAGSFSFIATKE